MVRFIDEHRDVYGVEPICEVLPIAPSTYFLQSARKANPELRPERTKRDEELSREVQRVHEENYSVYGAKLRRCGSSSSEKGSRRRAAPSSG